MIPRKYGFVKPFFKKNQKYCKKFRKVKKTRKNRPEFCKSLAIDTKKCYNKDKNFDKGGAYGISDSG